MENTMKVTYKYKNLSKTDLVCDLTKFIDKYIVLQPITNYPYQTYIYNDMQIFSTKHIKRMVIRAFGATRGVIGLKQITDNIYKIDRIKIYDSSFGVGIGCYDSKLANDVKKFKNYNLDFSEVTLIK